MALFGRKNSPVTPLPAPIEYKPEPAPAAKEELPELDFLKEPPVSEPAPAPAYQPAPAAFTPVNAEGVISKQPQYSQLVLETEKPPVITVCRYGTNYVATDHVRNLQAVERTEYEALEALIKQYKG